MQKKRVTDLWSQSEEVYIFDLTPDQIEALYEYHNVTKYEDYVQVVLNQNRQDEIAYLLSLNKPEKNPYVLKSYLTPDEEKFFLNSLADYDTTPIDNSEIINEYKQQLEDGENIDAITADILKRAMNGDFDA